ncbi:hypothetical protein MMC08_007745 [Hypocenomyce scalaris]|nr:hypothetical protein [Hypocenomyce scalaris]
MSSPLLTQEVEDGKRSLLSMEPEDSATKSSEVTPTMLLHANGNGKQPSSKTNNHQHLLDVPPQTSFRPSTDTVSDISTYSADNENERGTGRPFLTTNGPRLSSMSPAPAKTWKGAWAVFWARNKGMALVLLSQLFGGLMNVTTRLLETSGSDMHPFQILFARMSITAFLACIYMWRAKTPYFPLGMPEVRWLLVVRGFGGFFGVYGMYYSLLYLPIAEATVITFLAPLAACFVCSFLLHEPFTRTERICGFISLLGVVMISRPSSLLPGHDSPPIASGSADAAISANSTIPDHHGLESVTPAQRLNAVLVSMLGVLGSASVYITIRWIGKRAHPLISVNYFAIWCTFVSMLALLFLPNISFQLPANATEWAYLIFLGVFGVVMQILMTAGLQHEKSSRATNMVYTQMLFALFFDKVVWDATPGVWAMLGSGMILGSALFVAVRDDGGKAQAKRGEGNAEEVGLMEREEEGEEGGERGRGPLRGVQEVQLRTLRV